MSIYELLVELVLVGELVGTRVAIQVFRQLLPLVFHDIIVGRTRRTLAMARERSHQSENPQHL